MNVIKPLKLISWLMIITYFRYVEMILRVNVFKHRIIFLNNSIRSNDVKKYIFFPLTKY